MVLIVVVVLFAVVGYFAWKVMKQRGAAFAAAADGLGFNYQATGSPFTGTDVSGITLFSQTGQHQYRDVLTPKSAQRPVVVSQFTYQVFQNLLNKGSGATTSGGTMQQHSLIAYRLAHGSVPRFRLFTQGAFGNMGIPLDAQVYPGSTAKGTLDLGSAAFAKRYVLVAEDENAVRRFFTPELVNALVEQPPRTWLHIQTSPDWLLFYDPAMIILSPDAIAPAFARIDPIAARVLDSAPTTP